MLIPRNQQQVIGFLLAQKEKVEKKKVELHTFTFSNARFILADVPKHVLRKRKNSTFCFHLLLEKYYILMPQGYSVSIFFVVVEHTHTDQSCLPKGVIIVNYVC